MYNYRQMQEAKEDIRDRLNIEDVVGEYLELKRAGRNFKAISPFTNEKTASFIVSPDKKIWHDFSSGKGGDVFSFIMEVEGLDFKEAVNYLAKKAGVELKYYDTAKGQKVSEQKKREYTLNQLAVAYYQATLKRNNHALDYIKNKRAFTDKTILDFALGYAPNQGSALVDFLIKRGYKKTEIAQAGLTNQYGGDLFRGRIMIPLADQAGKIIGFTGRGLESDSVPKYLNTPSTLLYDKSNHLYGIDKAKVSIRKLNQAVIVEGHLDAISSHQAGQSNVVATGGTALTANHLKLLSRFTSDIRLAFDGDSAGVKATERAIELAQGEGVDVRIISIPEPAKDPDELIRLDRSLWERAIGEAKPAIDWLMQAYGNQFDVSTAQGKRDYSRNLLNVIEKISDSVEREAYMKKLAQKLDISIEALEAQRNAIDDLKDQQKTHFKQMKTGPTSPDASLYQDNLLALALIDLEIRHLVTELQTNLFDGQNRQEIVNFFAHNLKKLSIEDWSELKNNLIYAKVLSLRAEERYSTWPSDERMREAKHLLSQVEKDSHKVQTKNLTEKLRHAELAGDDELANSVRNELNQLIKEFNR